jgi:hypothetical protein
MNGLESPGFSRGEDVNDMTTNRHEAPEEPDTLRDRFRDAIAPRTLLLGIGVLLL